MRRRSTLQSVFERFTEHARQVVVLAQEEARALRHHYIGTEHILLGLFREEEGLATRMLESLDLRLEEVRAQVIRVIGEGTEEQELSARHFPQIPFTKHAKRVLELALREALSLGHNYIGTEHILLALVRENEGVAARILLDFDADAEKVRDAVIRMLRRQSGERLPPGDEPKVELVLRRVVPVAQQMADGTWVVSVEVWDHGLVLRWATSERPLPPRQRPFYNRDWLVSDDLGTSYDLGRSVTGGGTERGFHYDVEFLPAPAPDATSLRIRRESTNEELSVSLRD